MTIASKCILAVFIGSLGYQARAVVKTSSAKFHGTLIVSECRLNAGERQTVDFGDSVGLHHIDGKAYEQMVPFDLQCINYAGGNMPPLTLTLEGTPSSFNNAALATNVDGLGIELRRNGKVQELNTDVTLDYNNLPTLTAIPVVDTSAPLKAQTFTATMKITVEIP
ncbi:TPA: fimbrial protein [Salmonella enterica]